MCRPHRDLLDVKKLGGVEMCVCVCVDVLAAGSAKGPSPRSSRIATWKGEHVDAKKLVGARKT